MIRGRQRSTPSPGLARLDDGRTSWECRSCRTPKPEAHCRLLATSHRATVVRSVFLNTRTSNPTFPVYRASRRHRTQAGLSESIERSLSCPACGQLADLATRRDALPTAATLGITALRIITPCLSLGMLDDEASDALAAVAPAQLVRLAVCPETNDACLRRRDAQPTP